MKQTNTTPSGSPRTEERAIITVHQWMQGKFIHTKRGKTHHTNGAAAQNPCETQQLSQDNLVGHSKRMYSIAEFTLVMLGVCMLSKKNSNFPCLLENGDFFFFLTTTKFLVLRR